MVDPLTAIIAGAGLVGSFTIGAATITYASIAAYAVITAATLGLAYASSALSGPKGAREKQEAAQQQITTTQPVPPRVRAYGRVKIGGAKFFEAVGISDYLYRGIIHCEGPISKYWEWWSDSSQANITSGSLGGSANGINGTDNPKYESLLGKANQTRAVMLAEFDVASPTSGQLDWTVDHRLQGLAYTVVRFTTITAALFRTIYPSGSVPETRVVIDASLVYDPRDAAQVWADSNSWKWTDNAALCIMDYLTSSRGLRLPTSRIDAASFASFADVCDQSVSLKGGGSEHRYRLNGVYDLNEEPKEILRRMLQTCDAEIVPQEDGTLGIRGGVWTAPTVTITDDMILSYTLEQANNRLAAFNRIKVSFLSPAHDYQMAEGDPWDDLANQSLTGEVLTQDLSLAMVQSHSQARRLAKIVMAKGNPLYRLQLTTTLAALDALGERIVSLVLDDIGIGGTFFVEKFSIVAGASQCQIGLASLDASAYAWDPATEEGTPPPVPADTPQAVKPPNPLNVIPYQEQTATVYFVVDSINRGDVDLIGQYRVQGTTTWLDMDDAGDGASFPNAQPATTYEYRIAWLARGSALQSDWVGPFTYTPSFVATVPNPVTGLAAAQQSGGINDVNTSRAINVSWTAPATNYYTARIYRAEGASATLAEAVQVRIEPGAAGAADTWQDVGKRPGTTYRYWVYAANLYGVKSAVAGPVSVTPT